MKSKVFFIDNEVLITSPQDSKSIVHLFSHLIKTSYFYPKNFQMEILLLLSGFFAGFLIAWLLARSRYFRSGGNAEFEDLKSRYEMLNVQKQVNDEKIKTMVSELDLVKAEIREKENRILNLSTNLAAKNADFENLSSKLNEQKADLNLIREKFADGFKNLANEILHEKSIVFTEQNKESIGLLLKPLQEKLKDFEKKVEEVYDKEAQQRFSLKEEVKKLADLNQQVSLDAQNLTRALKGESKTQGNWGEMILESILEKSGLVKDREYFVQKSYSTGDGRRLQPDVVVAYPGNKNVLIDSKVSLTAYEKYSSANEKEIQEPALKNHLISVKRHIDELSAKNYPHIYNLNSVDFVMMFLPVEPAFMLAIQQEPGLWSFAYEKGIILTGPTNLFAALKMISALWQQEYQSRNVLEIAEQSGKLYDKFVGLVNDLIDVGTKLDAARKSHNDAMSKLSSGKGNLVSRVENIKQLGAKASKELPKTIVENNQENPE